MSNEFNFHNRTVGKWLFRPGSVSKDPAIVCVLEYGECAGETKSVGRIYRNEDARLVAAAPDLLDACKTGGLGRIEYDGPMLLRVAANALYASEIPAGDEIGDWLMNKATLEEDAIKKATAATPPHHHPRQGAGGGGGYCRGEEQGI